MRSAKNHPSTGQLLCHFLTGAGLGSVLAISLMNTHRLFADDALAVSPSPVMFSSALVIASASIIGIGSAITGALFSAIDRT
jgi:hypothetical protein